MAAQSVSLGIDLGTSSVKAALLEAAPGRPSGFMVLASCARPSRADAESKAAVPQVRQCPGAAASRSLPTPLFSKEVSCRGRFPS